jgi:hypothetical protein
MWARGDAMKQTPIRRKKGFARSSLPMKRSPLRRVSKKRAKENREYTVVRARYLMDHPKCEACYPVNSYLLVHITKASPSEEVHHKNGRTGRLLNYTPFFIAVCRKCHDWIGRNGAEARELGVLAPISEFNVYPE